jgi:hypothetical protein
VNECSILSIRPPDAVLLLLFFCSAHVLRVLVSRRLEILACSFVAFP